MGRISHVFRCVKGGAAIEYALVATLIAIAALGAMKALGGSIDAKLTNVSDTMNAQ
jgi:pilus assembly protein Flp/PilA